MLGAYCFKKTGSSSFFFFVSFGEECSDVDVNRNKTTDSFVLDVVNGVATSSILRVHARIIYSGVSL